MKIEEKEWTIIVSVIEEWNSILLKKTEKENSLTPTQGHRHVFTRRENGMPDFLFRHLTERVVMQNTQHPY